MMCIKDKTKNFIVYDPYAGIGTTCIVAQKFKINYIGSEISKEYYNISKKKLKQYKEQKKLF